MTSDLEVVVVRRDSLGITRVAASLVMVTVLAGTAAVAALVTLGAVRHRGGAGGEQGGGSPRAWVASVQASARDLLLTAHRDPAEAVNAWHDLAVKIVAAGDAGQQAAAVSAVDRALAAAVSTSQGQAALAVTQAALDGQVLAVPASPRALASSRAGRATRTMHTPSLRSYFVNGILDDAGTSAYLAAQLGAIYRTPLQLVFRRSSLAPAGYAVVLCLRGIAARYPDPAAAANTAMDTVLAQADEEAREPAGAQPGGGAPASAGARAGDDVVVAGDAALAGACRTAAGVVGREAGSGTLRDFITASAGLVTTWLARATRAGAATAPDGTVDALRDAVRRDLLAGDPVVLTGHDQGTIVTRRVFRDTGAWWEQARASGELDGCWPQTPPVGSLYLSPAFWSGWSRDSATFPEDENGFDLQRRLQRYVALRGDALAQLRDTGWVSFTAEPDQAQRTALTGYEPVRLHLLQTYLMSPDDVSNSRDQIGGRFAELRDDVTTMAPYMSPNIWPDANLTNCRGRAAGSSATAGTAGTAGAGGTASSTPAPASEPSPDDGDPAAGGTTGAPSTEADTWMVWRALEPFAGIGINVTPKRVYEDATELASSYSGGGLSPTATFTKELLLDQEFPSEQEALAALCAGLSDVRMWPLGTGMHGVWKGTAYPLGDSVACPSSSSSSS
jgi:hypothetical protein